MHAWLHDGYVYMRTYLHGNTIQNRMKRWRRGGGRGGTTAKVTRGQVFLVERCEMVNLARKGCEKDVLSRKKEEDKKEGLSWMDETTSKISF